MHRQHYYQLISLCHKTITRTVRLYTFIFPSDICFIGKTRTKIHYCLNQTFTGASWDKRIISSNSWTGLKKIPWCHNFFSRAWCNVSKTRGHHRDSYLVQLCRFVLRVHGVRHCAAARPSRCGSWESADRAQTVICAGVRVRSSAGAFFYWMEVVLTATPI